ncbi:Uncharacterised protein (plasmid) [Legionella adelaidensis]|uniref:Uncharacterized protein n=1 Tax=Legionella adelaidensis TaxID=45056 RepID=A0A0W0R1Z3_9GAMM|nr:hypothetical protein [Legionella adelaidensis]KTC65119.1 hypothetical protein Lade_1642 [Legionella adelaidensis]VEH85361.1 Uncharacterised protein [Legionella adelaidensis]
MGAPHKNKKVFLFITILLFFSLCKAENSKNIHPRAEERKNVVNSFFGNSLIENKSYFTYGVEYHRVLTFPLGITLEMEDTPNKDKNHEVEIFSLMTWNFLNHFTAGIGPGLKFEKNHSTKTMGRLNLGYITLVANDIEVTPNINFDTVEALKSEWVAGISIGKQF